MPIPGTNVPWPWEQQTSGQAQQPQQPQGPTQAQVDALGQYAAQHGGAPIGQPISQANPNDPSQIVSAWTFPDGSILSLGPNGENFGASAPTQKPPTGTAATAAETGVLNIGGQAWIPDPQNPSQYIPSPLAQGQAQLAGGETVARTGLTQQQANLYGAQAQAYPQTAAAQQAVQGAQAGLYGAQTGLYGAQAAAYPQTAAAQQALQQAQAGLYGAQAQAYPGTAAAQQALQSAQAGLYGAQAQAYPGTAQAQQALQTAQAGLYGAQAQAYPQTAAAQAGLYGAQAANQMAQAAAATTPAQLTVNLQNQARAQQQALQQKVAQGTLTSDQAANQFDQWWTGNVEPMKQQIGVQQAQQQNALALQQAQAGLYQAQAANYPQAQALAQATLANTAANQAQTNALSLMSHLAPSNAPQILQGAMTTNARGFPSINAGQAMQAGMFSVPNLQEIGRLGAAAALADVSPTAQMHLQTPGPLIQPRAQALPDLSGLLNAGAYGFGAPPAAALPAGATPAALASPTPVSATGADTSSGIDWTALLQRQQADAQAQQIQAQIPWGQYAPAAA